MYRTRIVTVALALIGAFACSSGAGDDDADGDLGERPSGTRPDVDSVAEVGNDATDDGAPDAAVDIEPAEPVAIGLEITPALLELETALGVPVEGSFEAVATMSDGETIDVTDTVTWRSSRVTWVSIAAGGTVVAHGTAAGSVTISAELESLRTEATVVVRVASWALDEDITPEEAAEFEASGFADPPTPPTWLYPEDGTVYPAGLVSPEFQWRPVGPGISHLSLRVEDLARVDVLTRGTRVALSEAQWSLLSKLHGRPIEIDVTWAPELGAPRSVSGTTRMRTADAQLEGAVYYWQIRTGDIMEIPHDSVSARPLFPDNALTGTCRGCHAITRDGGRIGFMYNGGDNPRAGLAWVGAPDPPVIENHSTHRWDFLSFDPAGLRAAAVFHGEMWLADVTPGLAEGVRHISDVPAVSRDGRRATQPAWSPDGTLLAYVDRNPSGVDWSFDGGDLMVLPWDAGSETFGEPQLLIERGVGDDDTLSYPTWSPDSRWIAYSQGPSNRGDPPATLWIAEPLTGDRTRLQRGAPAGLDVLPAFSPFREGGYYWLLFYSSRPYGDVTSNKQLWVMAVDVGHVPGVDPSHAAFWLPGQDAAESNITGYWARTGCVREADECKTDLDCCVGLRCLRDDEREIETCQRVDCVLPGHPCTPADTCCPGYECASSLVGTTVCVELFE